MLISPSPTRYPQAFPKRALRLHFGLPWLVVLIPLAACAPEKAPDLQSILEHHALPAPAHHQCLETADSSAAGFLSCLFDIHAHADSLVKKTFTSREALGDSLEDFARRLESGLARAPSDSHRVQEIISFVYDTLALDPVIEDQREDSWILGRLLERREGSCVALASLFLGLGAELKMPLHGVFLPGHFFITWRKGEYSRHVETLRRGLARSDSFYRDYFHLPRHPWYGIKPRRGAEALAASLFNLGNLHRSRGEHLLAAREFARVALLLPGFPEALGNLAVTLMELDRQTEALVILQEAATHAPHSRKVLANLGMLYIARKQWQQAHKVLKPLVEAEPGNRELAERLELVERKL